MRDIAGQNDIYVEDEFGNRYWFTFELDDWRCFNIEYEKEPEYHTRDIIEEKDYFSQEIDQSKDYYTFDKDGFTYSVEAMDEDEYGDYHRWRVSDVEIENQLFDENRYALTEDFRKYDIFDRDGNRVNINDLENNMIGNSKKPIKSAVDGGWEVRSSDVPEALDLFVEYFGEEYALESIAKAMSSDTLKENIEWITRQWGIADEIEEGDSWEQYEQVKEIMGAHELYEELTRAAGYDELAEDLAFIFRMHDFREWDKYDEEEEDEEIESSCHGKSKKDKGKKKPVKSGKGNSYLNVPVPGEATGNEIRSFLEREYYERIRQDLDDLIYSYQEELGIISGDTQVSIEPAIDTIIDILTDQYGNRR